MPRIDDRDLYLHNRDLMKVLTDISGHLSDIAAAVTELSETSKDQASKADVAREMLNTVLGDIEED